MNMNQPPLVVDLDGTLSNSDISIESGINFIRNHPARLLEVLSWLTRGRAYMKEKFAQYSTIDADDIPYNGHVIALIGEERAKGRLTVLATASHITYAQQIADHLGLFDRVLATE